MTMESKPEEKPVWNPDCLDRFLGCWKGSPKTVAATGYYMLRIIYSVLTVYSTITFGGVITFAALKATHCLSNGSDGNGQCQGSEDGEGDDGTCVRLWGIIKPDSLLPVISTIAAIIVALSASLIGTAMDITDWRRQFGLAAYGLALVGMALCLSISTPNEGTLILCSIGLIMIVICKAYVLVQVDSYGPELSQVQAEVGTAISGAFAWSLICNVLLVILWSLIGMGMTNSEYGLAVTIGSMILAALCSIVTYRRLPDVPAAHKLPEGVNIVQHTFRRFATLISETYRDYPDLGLIIFAGMLFDPALTAILAAAVSIMISRYSFSADQVTMILGLAIIAAIPAVPLSRWIPSTPSLTWLFNDAHDPNATVFPSAIDPKAPVGAGLEMTEDLPYLGVPTHPVDDAEAGGGGNGNGAGAAAEEGETAKMAPAASLTTTPNSSGMEEQQVGQGHKHVTVFHPYRVRAALIVGLALTILNTILLVQILTPCNFGLACLFSAIWGFLLSFCWNSNSMLRISVVPGGRESEFAGLYMAVFSSMIWLPLFVFSVANEVWSIGGALYILTIFMGLGGLVLFFVRLDRGLAARQRTLGMRRWVSTGKADAAAETGAGETA